MYKTLEGPAAETARALLPPDFAISFTWEASTCMSNFEGKIFNVTQQAVKEVYGLDVGPDTLVVEVPRNKDNGDYATGVAMKLAR